MLQDAGTPENIADVAAAHHQNHGQGAGVAAFHELFQGVRARGVQPEHAGQAQDHKAGGLAVFLLKLAFQFVNGPEEKRAFNDIDGNARRHVRRRVAQQGGVGPEPDHARVRGLVNVEQQRDQHTHENGLFQIQEQGGGKGQQQHGAVHTRGHQAEADGARVKSLHRDEQ